MIMTRTFAAASMAALIGGVVPQAAFAAGEMPPLAPKPAPASQTPPPIPGQPAAAPSATWYVVVDGRAVGPLTDREVLARIESGAVAPDALVWQPGMTDWQPADQSMPLVAQRVKRSLEEPGLPTRRDGLFYYASWR